jgi:serine/threonine protein kinase
VVLARCRKGYTYPHRRKKNDVTDTHTVALKIFHRSLSDDEHDIRNEVYRLLMACGVYHVLIVDLGQQQIRVLEMCDHPNIVGYLGSYLWHDHVWLALEFCGGGTLSFLIKHVSLREAHIAFISKQVCQPCITVMHLSRSY